MSQKPGFVLDTSAVIAWMFREPPHAELTSLLSDAEVLGIGTPTLLEASIVATHKVGRDARTEVARFLVEFGVEAVDFLAPHQREAALAWLKFGKGRHPAKLNYGDCMSYAVAKLAGLPLLCIGDDFPLTDLPIEQPTA